MIRQHETLLAITSALLGAYDPQRLFTAVAEHLRQVFPVDAFGISYYDHRTDSFTRGMVMTADGAIMSPEPSLRSGTALEAICNGGKAVLLDEDLARRALVQFVGLHTPPPDQQTAIVFLPVYGREHNLLAVAAGLNSAGYTYTPDDLAFLDQLGIQIGLAIENMQLHQENARLRMRLEAEGQYLKEEIERAADVGGLIYASRPMDDAMQQILRSAPTDASVLLIGETGTGKELFARTLHAHSASAHRPLVRVNCGAIPSGLIESTLFGHEKGAFTGAVNRHIGLFEVADGGTLFLDEIGELPLDMQVKLLRVLQEGEFTRVGGHEPLHVEVRIIAATNRPIEEMVTAGTFRADLYYRLAVVPIAIPPLRSRPEDIPLLTTAFIQKYSRRFHKPVRQISREALQILEQYPFPGNVRELENLIERAVVLCDDTVLGPGHFPVPTGAALRQPVPSTSFTTDEREQILAALHQANWIIEGARGAARRLGIKPSTLRGRMSRLGIERDTDSPPLS
jgi:transcriptional regulator with GAF, ATPase, and Fis domain